MYTFWVNNKPISLEPIGEQSYIDKRGKPAKGFHYDARMKLPDGTILRVTFASSVSFGGVSSYQMRSVRSYGSEVDYLDDLGDILCSTCVEWMDSHNHLLGMTSSIPSSEITTKCGVRLPRREYYIHITQCEFCRGITKGKDWFDPTLPQAIKKSTFRFPGRCDDCDAVYEYSNREFTVHLNIPIEEQ